VEEKLFGLDLRTDGIEILLRDGRYFVRYDAGAHQVAWRQDQVTEQEAKKIQSGSRGVSEVLSDLQHRLGLDAFKSNWNP
jgi:hypothetical protein